MDPPPTPPSRASSDTGIVLVSPRISPTPPLPLPLDSSHSPVDPEAASQSELFLASLASGESSRTRRLGPTSSEPDSSSPPPFPDTFENLEARLASIRREADRRYSLSTAEHTRIVRPTVAELERMARRFQEAEEDARRARREYENQVREEIRETGGAETRVWRNEPIPIPRTSSLPRGGRTFPSSSSTPVPSTTFSPQNPPSPHRSSSSPFTRTPSRRHLFSPPPPPPARAQLSPIPPVPPIPPNTSLPSFETLFARIAATSSSSSSSDQGNTIHLTTYRGTGNEGGYTGSRNLRSYLLDPPTHVVGDSFFNDHDQEHEDYNEDEEDEEADLSYRQRRRELRETWEAAGWNEERRNGNGGWTVINRPFDSNTTTTRTATRDSGSGNGSGIGRSREETNSLAGRALRSKKGVHLIYCGGQEGDTEGEGMNVPRGFRTTTPVEGDGKDGKRGGGCGALLCARGLIEGVPKKVFVDGGNELEGYSSDLPPSISGLADLEDEEEKLEEKVGKRGWKGCRGCVTRDLGCRRCGNHVGYRLLRPDVYCSIARNVVGTTTSETSPWRRITGAGAIAGGVTGGGVVDGLLFFFRKDRTTTLRRRMGVVPKGELEDDRAEDEQRGKPGEGGNGEGHGEGEAQRLKEKVPEEGEGMIWKHIPSPQRDFRDGLISEPLDWLTPNQETWWLENSISKHSYSINGTRSGSGRRSNTRKRPAEEELDQHATDSLSSATTTIDSRPRSGSGASLSRSHAIRRNIPLSGSSPASNSNEGSSSIANYDRYRSDAQTYARRVRQRLDDNGETSANGPGSRNAAGTGNDVVASLERAGYGSWYDNGADADDADDFIDEAKVGTRVKARQSVGR